MRLIQFPRFSGAVARSRFWIRASLLFILAFAGGPDAARAQTVFLNFDTPGEYTNNFNVWENNGGVNGGSYSFTESATAGVGGGGGVSVYQSTDTTATYNQGSWNLATNGANIIVSVLLEANGASGSDKVQLGVANSDTNGLNSNDGVAFESFRFIPNGPASWSFQEQYQTGGNSTTTTMGNVNVVAGRWYKFVLAITNTSGPSGNLAVSAALYDYGTNGLTPGTNLITFPTAVSHSGEDIAGDTSVYPALRAFEDAGIGAWDNFLVYQTNSRPVFTLPLTNVTVTSGNPVSLNAVADGPGVISYSWYTNNVLIAGVIGTGYTIPPVGTNSLNVSVVAANGNGSTTNSATVTVFVPTPEPPTVTNAVATAVQTTFATLGGGIVAVGSGTPTVTIYFGPTDGGTNPSAWANSVSLGTQVGTFSQTVYGLTPGTTYYFTVSAGNNAGPAWATPSRSFTTLVPTPATVANSAATAVGTTTATLGGQIVAVGTATPSVTIYFGPTDGGADASAWSNSVSLGAQTGAFSQIVPGLSPGTLYYFTAAAVSRAGTGWAAPSLSFTTARPSPAVVTNLPASSIGATRATVGGQVTSVAADPPTITLFYGETDGGTNSSAWASSLVLGVQSGYYFQTLGGLTSNTTYYYTSEAVNSAGAAWARPSLSFTTAASDPVSTAIPVTTYHYDNSRAGVNSNETVLTLANVNTNTFGRLFAYVVDGYVYAQPLYMPGVTIPGKGVHNVVFVATEHESVYAFDADSNTGSNAGPLWQTSFINPAAGIYTVSASDTSSLDIVPEVGITSTPVIDPVTGTLYAEGKTSEGPDGNTYVHRLHALDITTGLERTNFGSPVIISSTNYPGTGEAGYADNDGAGHVSWNPMREHNRPALMLLNGVVYVAFASHGDQQPYHGWLFGYNGTNISQQVSVYNTTPNGGYGGFWQGGGGPTVDSAGYFYLVTGNGSFDAVGPTFNQATNAFGSSVIKFAVSNGVPAIVDYFTPFNQAALSGFDQDLGSGAALVLPDSAGSAAHPHLLVASGKGAKIYLIDRDNMGRYDNASGNASDDTQIVQVYRYALDNPNTGNVGSYSTPAFFNNTLYYVGWNAPLQAFPMVDGLISTNPVGGPTVFGTYGATPSITANGTSNAIVWTIQTDAYLSSGPAILRAYNATNVTRELYNSTQAGARDNPGAAVKFTVPTVVNGKVYVGAQYALSVFGSGLFLATPTIAPNGGTYTNSIVITLADASPGTTLYYTLDGTAPTTNSTPYTGPFTLTNNALVQAVAVEAGALNSAVAGASFINNSSVGTGTGLLGKYYGNVTDTDNPFPGAPTLERTDPVIDFIWSGTGPGGGIGQQNYTVMWSGMVQPQFSQTYNFLLTSDDGSRMFINGNLLIDAWQPQAPTTTSNTITLVAQQYYNIEVDYFQAGGGAQVDLQWTGPSTPLADVPETQLYPVTNPPPAINWLGPANGSNFTAAASVTMSANASAQYNAVGAVVFYANGAAIGTVTNPPYTLTATGLVAGVYQLSAVASDTSGLSSTSAPVTITVTNGSGLPYGLTVQGAPPAFFNMPRSSSGTLPATLSQTGIFTNTPAMDTASGLIPYNVNTPLWSDGALKTRWFSVPATAPGTPASQIAFAPAGEWTFPAGSVFVKHFALITNYANPNAPVRRLETRVLVRDTNGAVYGVTYKWRPDNSDADLVTSALSESIVITNPGGLSTQVWYYPSPTDCLTCHTPVASYVLGVKTRQLDGDFTYPSTGVTDNQLRTLNRLGLFYPAIDETAIAGFVKLVAVTNQSAPLVDRFRSYIDANCGQCHRPNGTGPSFDANYDTPLTNQNIINGVLQKGNLGYDNARIVVPDDLYRSVLYDRINTTNPAIQMPPLARNLIDTNAVPVIAAWINSLPGTPALLPPVINPDGGTYNQPVTVTLTPPDTNATLYYTLDGSLPTTNSTLYLSPFTLTNSVTVNANAFENGYNNSVAATAQFSVFSTITLVESHFLTNGVFQMQLSGVAGQNYILQATTNFSTWISISTNVPLSSPFYLEDPGATNYRYRFYRAVGP